MSEDTNQSQTNLSQTPQDMTLADVTQGSPTLVVSKNLTRPESSQSTPVQRSLDGQKLGNSSLGRDQEGSQADELKDPTLLPPDRLSS